MEMTCGSCAGGDHQCDHDGCVCGQRIENPCFEPYGARLLMTTIGEGAGGWQFVPRDCK